MTRRGSKKGVEGDTRWLSKELRLFHNKELRILGRGREDVFPLPIQTKVYSIIVMRLSAQQAWTRTGWWSNSHWSKAR